LAGARAPRREHRPSDFEVFDELEGQHLRPHHECGADSRQPTWMAGKVAVAAILVLFVGLLTLLARSVGDASDTGQQSVVAASNAAEPH